MAAPLTLTDRLREETAVAHARLERDMGLTPQTVSEERIGQVLLRFRTFFSVWEPWIESSPVERAFFEPRRKLPLIDKDLAALGLSPGDVVVAERISLGTPSLGRALGSMYVVEGSTLGGQVINRWLKGAAWSPEGGLAYFGSYGRDVGRMWRSFRHMVDNAVPASDQDEVVEAAIVTFDRIHACVCSRKELA